MKSKKVLLWIGIALAACATHTSLTACAQPKHTSSNPPQPTVLAVTSQISVRYGGGWSESATKYANAHELIRLATAKPGASAAASQVPRARVLITTEQRLSRADARRRLVAIARTRSATPMFYSIGGWPAVEVRFQEPLARSEADDAEDGQEPRRMVQRAMLAIAAGQQVVDFDIWVGPGVPGAMLKEALTVARSASLPGKERPQELDHILKELKQSAQQSKPRTLSPGSVPATVTMPRIAAPRGLLTVHPNLPALLPQGGRGELEIASDNTAQNIVIAGNAGLSYSTDFGATFFATFLSGTLQFGMSDPSLTRGQSNTFYLGGIAKIAEGINRGCNDWVARSADNTGATFTVQGFSAACSISGPGLCFPDQPHIAADAFNPSSSGQDQVYAVWRLVQPASGSPSTCNAPGGFSGSTTAVIACSNDSGANWSSPTALPGSGDHPRVAVGRDGKVYAVTQDGHSVVLTRLSSCSSMPPLSVDAGFPVTVIDGVATVNCPLPGLDRCEEALSSPTVAPDPKDPAHLFVTYAQHADAPPVPWGFDFEWIVSRESRSSGSSFGREFILNKTPARRFMPWSCSTNGTVFAAWYDRDLLELNDDATDYVLGSPLFAQTIDLTGSLDPQCVIWGTGSGATRSPDDSTSCTVQPQLAGRCASNGFPCDFKGHDCPRSGDSCQTGSGVPKYGDYNGVACADDRIITAWTSTTAPSDLPAGSPPVTGLSLFARVVPLTPPNGPPTFDQLLIEVNTGVDDARGSSEITAKLGSDSSLICLKPSNSLPPDGICPNGNGAADQTGRDNWQPGDGTISQTFAVVTPQLSPGQGFGSITITLIQGPCVACTSDNWNLEDIKVTALDSSRRLANAVLLDMGAGGRPTDTSCIARLEDQPWSQTVEFSLHNPPTSGHVYRGGKADGLDTSCTNNQD